MRLTSRYHSCWTSLVLHSFVGVAVFACGEGPVEVESTVESVSVTPATTAIVSLGATQQFSAAARDGSGNTLAGVSFTWSSSDEDCATVNTSGLVTAVGNGVATISAAAAGTNGGATVTVAQVGVELVFSVQPVETYAGVTIEPAVEVEVRDANGHAVENATETVALAIGENPGAGTLSGTTTVVPENGVATFDDLTIDEDGTGYTLTATTGSVPAATSASFDVVAIGFTVVGTGDSHTCALTSLGEAFCWGDNSVGQLGDETSASSTGPVPVTGNLRFEELTGSGGDHTCGLTGNGEAYCWGENAMGQLGDGTKINSNVPVRAASNFTFTSLAAGVYHTCGVTSAGEAYCWGSNAADAIEGYALGGPTTEMCDNPDAPYRGDTWPCSPTPVAVAGGMSFRSIAAGAWATCGIAVSGETYCWGWNNFNELGDGTDVDATAPTLVAGDLSFDQVSFGALHACGLVGQNAYCWGGGVGTYYYGYLGTGSFDPSSTPASVVGGLGIAALAPSDGNNIYAFTCGLTTEGAAYCWGAGATGALGTTTAPLDCYIRGYASPCSNAPLPVEGGITFVSIDAGSEFACGVAQSGDAYCWGSNEFGQLGDGTTDDATTPVLVVMP